MELKTIATVVEGDGKATEEQIAAWKKLYGEVFEIEVRGKFCYLRGFDRATMKLALSQLNVKINTEDQSADFDMNKTIEIGEIGLQNCWLYGAEEIKNNDGLWIAASLQAGSLFNLEETKLKKL